MLPELVITGALNWDVNLFVKHLPRSGQEVVVERIDRVPGGKGGNVAVAAARILGPKRVALLACVGRDDVGKKQIAVLRDEGVDVSGVQILDRVESGQAYVTVDEKGSNVIETHFGANAGLRREHLMTPTVQSIFAAVRMMVVIDPPRGVAGKLLAEGSRLRRSVMWHPGVLTRFGLDEFREDMQGLDYLVLNEHEASQFVGVRGLEDSLSSIGRVAPRAKILVTLGGRGAAFYSEGKLLKMGGVSLEKLGRKVVNTTGSGDAFVGVFSSYKILGFDDLDAFRYANLAGALKASRPETRGSPARKELEGAFREYWPDGGSGLGVGRFY